MTRSKLLQLETLGRHDKINHLQSEARPQFEPCLSLGSNLLRNPEPAQNDRPSFLGLLVVLDEQSKGITL